MKRSLSILIALSLFFISCVSNEASLKPVTQVTQERLEVQKAPWEMEWGKTIKDAAKEGKLVITLVGEPEPTKAVSDGFKRRYGITSEILAAGVGLIHEKLLRERRAGIYSMDVLFGGSTTMMGLKPSGALEPVEPLLILPEVTEPKVWWKGRLDFIERDKLALAFSATPTVPWAINTEIVKTGEEPRSWKDLLEPRWKGKIGMGDPRIDGNASTNFSVVGYFQPELGLDYWRELSRQEPVILRDQNQQVEWLARGKYSLLISPATKTMTRYMQAGAPLKWVTPKGTGSISTGSAIVSLLNQAPHPNAAKTFINYLLTREGQTLYSVASGYQSGRVDVPTDHLESLKVRQPGVEYIETYHEDFSIKTIESRKQAIEIFGK